MLSAEGEPGSLFGWPFSSLINCSRHSATRAWRAAANTTTTLQLNLQIPHWSFVISVSMLMRYDSSKGRSHPSCRLSGVVRILMLCEWKREQLFLFDNFRVSLCFFCFTGNWRKYIYPLRTERFEWISVGTIKYIFCIWLLFSFLIEEEKIQIWLLKMCSSEHGGFACCMFTQSHTSAPGPSLKKPCCERWGIDSGGKAGTVGFKRLPWSHTGGQHAGRDRQQWRETPWRSGLLLPHEGQRLDREGLAFCNLLPGAEEMLACFLETPCAPWVYHRTPNCDPCGALVTLWSLYTDLSSLSCVLALLSCLRMGGAWLHETNKKECAVSKSQFRICPTLPWWLLHYSLIFM